MGSFHGAEGSNAVEFALVLPILLVLAFGAITGGLLYDQQQTLTHAAREGARFGAILPDATSGSCDAAQYSDPDSWCSGVRARTIDASHGLLDEANVDTIAYDETDDEITVRVEREGRLDIIFSSWSPVLTAASIARYEQAGDE